ncbi:MAG: VWA domain-containing protein [Acidobacteriota bacterium]|jgi:VWFA-related protein
MRQVKMTLCATILMIALFSVAAASQKAIQVNVTLVTVPVMVMDKAGKCIRDLKASDFRVFENGKEQKIDRLVPDSEPFNVALLIDSSGSTHFRSGEMQQAALAFVDALRPGDRLMVASFDGRISYNSGFTDDHPVLRAAIAQEHQGILTWLYDAVDSVMKERLDRISGRKAMVLFTDGVDNESQRVDAVGSLANIERSDVIVYAIQYDTRKDGLSDRFAVPPPPGYATFGELYARAVRYLRDLTSHSGGRLFRAETMGSLQEAFSQVAQELSLQYTLCYYPADQKHGGSYRRLRVTVDRPNVIVRARTGYRPNSPSDHPGWPR